MRIDVPEFAKLRKNPVLFCIFKTLHFQTIWNCGKKESKSYSGKYTEKTEALKRYGAKEIAESMSKDINNDVETDSNLIKAGQSSNQSDGRDVVNNTADLVPNPKDAFWFKYDEKENGWSILSLLDKTYTEIIISEEYQGKPVKAIDHGAFKDCERLTSVTIPSSVYSIKSRAFSRCKSLTSITIAYGVYKIGAWAFQECQSLTNILIPDSVKNIDDYAFAGCWSLTNITIPSELYVFGEQVFCDCNKLEKIIWPQYGGKEMQMRVQDFYQKLGRCRYCGGSFKKGLFSIKCKECGEKKDY